VWRINDAVFFPLKISSGRERLAPSSGCWISKAHVVATKSIVCSRARAHNRWHVPAPRDATQRRQDARVLVSRHPQADRVEYLESNSRQSLVAMTAGDCGGVKEHGTSGNGSVRNLGDPPPSWSGSQRIEYANRTNYSEASKCDGLRTKAKQTTPPPTTRVSCRELLHQNHLEAKGSGRPYVTTLCVLRG
jgi:hypothetical protein